MIHVNVTKESNFPISVSKVKKVIQKTLRENGLVSDSEVSVAIVKKETMHDYVDEYYGDGDDHPVLSFPTSEVRGRFVFPPNNKLYLGEIIISYDWSFAQAARKGKIPEDVVCELAEHGTLHLLGIHHD